MAIDNQVSSAGAGAPADPTQAQTPAAQPAPGPVVGGVPTATPKNNKKLIIGLVVALVVLVGGFFGYRFYQQMQADKSVKRALQAIGSNRDLASSTTSGNGLNTLSDVDNIGNDVLGTKSKITSMEFEGKLEATGIPALSQPITFTGAAAESGAMQLTIGANIEGTKASLELRSTDGKDGYLRADGLEALGSLVSGFTGGSATEVAPLLQQFNNKWYSLPEGSLGQESQDSQSQSEDDKKYEDAYAQHPFLRVGKREDGGKVAGVPTFRYPVTIDKNELKEFYRAARAAGAKDLQDEEVFNAAIKDIDDTDFSQLKIYVWISKKDFSVKQVQITFTEAGATFTVTFTILSVNKEVKVEKPEGATPFSEIFGGLGPFSGGLGGAPATEGDLGPNLLDVPATETDF